MKTMYGETLYNRVRNKWVVEPLADHNTVDHTITRYNFFKEKNLIKEPMSNISFWSDKTFADFEAYIYSIDLIYEKIQIVKQKRKDVAVVFENEHAKVIMPNTYEAICKYGANTKWCVASKGSMIWWNIYNTDVRSTYYILPKKGDQKYLVVTEHSNVGQAVANINYPLLAQEFFDILDKLEIPRSLFSYKIECMKDKQTPAVKPCLYCNKDGTCMKEVDSAEPCVIILNK